MTTGWTIGNYFGIPVRVHYSMLFLLLTYDWMPGAGVMGLLHWLALMVLVFGSILVHELGHALTARRYGIQTADIVLTPIGGIARLLSSPKTPGQEIAIAVAGPIVSLVLAAIFYAATQVAWMVGAPETAVVTIYSLFWINRMLGLFNLVPALPMDGGRVLRGILELKRDHLTATRIAARVSRTIAVTGGFLAVLGSSLGYFRFQWSLVLIAGFIYMAAGGELRLAQIKAAQARAGAGGYGPFPGAQVRRVWRWPPSPGGGQGYPPAGAGPIPFDDDPFRRPADLEQEPREVVVVTGGRAEVISRNDKKD